MTANRSDTMKPASDGLAAIHPSEHAIGGARQRSLCLFLLLALAGAFLLDLGTGSVFIPPGQVVRILMGGEPERATWSQIILLFRLPKALTAVAAGTGLALSGLMMQTLFRNPLAGPSILGINAGASLGVALVVLTASTGRGASFIGGLGLYGNLGLVVAAALGASVVLIVIMILAPRVESVMTLLIIGILCGFALNAVVSVLVHFSSAERVQTYLTWTFGSFGAATWRELKIFLPVVAVVACACQLLRKPLNVLLLGEVYARSLGVKIVGIRLIMIALTAVLAGTVTAYCGPIGFLGIAVPHLTRVLLNTSDHRLLLPFVALVGATLALAADVFAQLPGSSAVLPLNAVTALIGSPVIVWMILKRRNLQKTFS